MVFNGIRKVFSTENDEQFETIGLFWDELSRLYGIEKLRGLGLNWTENTLEYIIGLKVGDIPGADCNVLLPEDGWMHVRGRLADLGKIYDDIYRDGPLKYEIEMFDRDGGCEIWYRR